MYFFSLFRCFYLQLIRFVYRLLRRHTKWYIFFLFTLRCLWGRILTFKVFVTADLFVILLNPFSHKRYGFLLLILSRVFFIQINRWFSFFQLWLCLNYFIALFLLKFTVLPVQRYLLRLLKLVDYVNKVV